jgi:hypothetical protein
MAAGLARQRGGDVPGHRERLEGAGQYRTRPPSHNDRAPGTTTTLKNFRRHTEVVPEAIEGSLMLASHALALVEPMPMRR